MHPSSHSVSIGKPTRLYLNRLPRRVRVILFRQVYGIVSDCRSEPSNFNRMVLHFSSMYSARTLAPFGIILLVIPSMLALPLGDAGLPFRCPRYADHYQQVTTSSVRDGTSFQGFSCPGGGTLGYSMGAAISVSFTIGAELKLKLEDIFKAGVSSTVSFSSTRSSAGRASMKCPPGPWTCALVVIPKIRVVSGIVRRFGQTNDCSGQLYYFELIAPDVDEHKVANLGIDMCTCKNKFGWAVPGHIGLLCNSDC